MANKSNEPYILSEEPQSVKINIQDPNKPRQNSGGTIIRKPRKVPWYDKVISALFGGEVDHENLPDHLIKNYAVPFGQRMLNNGIQNGLKKTGEAAQVLIFGHVVNSTSGPTDYTSFSKPGAVTSPGVYQVSDSVEIFAFREKQKAEECLAYLKGRIQTYQSVGVLDYFEWLNENLRAGISLDYNMADRGWKDLSNVRILTDPNGYIIDFPKPVFLKRG